MKRIVLLLLLFPTFVFAKDITSESNIKINDIINNKIIDNNEKTYALIKKDDIINISSEEDIYSIYIEYELESKEGIISNDTKSANIGVNSFLHEYIDVYNSIGPSKKINLTYNEDVKIADIYVIGKGELPSYVEIWQPPCKEADLLLFSTHADDEHLFFAGLLPTYVARGANVEVVYFTNHYNKPIRLHEQLHGLYAVGIRNYPVIGIVPDKYSYDLNSAISNLNSSKLSVDDAIKFEVEMLRRFKPLVVVGHDELGEYGHGQHMLNTYVLKQSVEKANDSEYDYESFDKYGLWEVKKVYIHSYKNNKIVMNYDEPLDYFNGKTAYQVSKEGYSKHKSQQWAWFTKWLNGNNNEYKKSTEIKTYSPNYFGLYYTKVGEDVLKNDMFENLTLRKDEIKETIKEENNDDNTEEQNNISIVRVVLYTILILSIIVLIIAVIKLIKISF